MATMQLAVMSPEPVDGAALLNIHEVSRMTNLSIGTLKAMNLSGDGPAYTEEYGRIRYTLAAVREFQAKRSAAHRRLIETCSVGCAHGNTAPAIAGFASGIPDRLRVVRIGNGQYCRVGRRA